MMIYTETVQLTGAPLAPYTIAVPIGAQSMTLDFTFSDPAVLPSGLILVSQSGQYGKPSYVVRAYELVTSLIAPWTDGNGSYVTLQSAGNVSGVLRLTLTDEVLSPTRYIASAYAP